MGCVLEQKECLKKFSNNLIEYRKQIFKKMMNGNLLAELGNMRTRTMKNNKRRENLYMSSKVPLPEPIIASRSLDRINQFCRQSPEITWLEMVRLVCLMIKTLSAMQKKGCILERVTYRNIFDQYRVAVNTTEMGKEKQVSHNPKDYSANKTLFVSTEAIKIMQKSPETRSDEDIMTIYALMMNLPTFQTTAGYSNELMWKLAKNFMYFRCEAKRVLTIINRKPINVYFIFSGTVSVLVDTEMANPQFPEMKKTINLTSGACIGHSNTSSHCICITDCEFLRIDKQVYIDEGIFEVQRKEMEDRFTFFRSWAPLEEWSDNAVYDIAILSYTNTYASGSLILEDVKDEEFDLIWFVLKGKVDVVKVIPMEDCLNFNFDNTSTKISKLKTRARQLAFVDGSLKGITQKSSKFPDICKKVSSSFSSESHANVFTHKKTIENQKTPIYLKMRSLFSGECYGLDNMGSEKLPILESSHLKTTNRFCLISRGCTVIRLSCSHFYQLIKDLGVDYNALKSSLFSLNPDSVICENVTREFHNMKRRQQMIESLLQTYPSKIKTDNFISHLIGTESVLKKGREVFPNYLFPVKYVTRGTFKVINPFYRIAQNKKDRFYCLPPIRINK